MTGDIETLDVLLVEDDPGDVLVAMAAFERRGNRHRLHVVRDAVEAMQFLYGTGVYVDAPRPTLILLDLALTRGSGLEVLAVVKSDPALDQIPVIVLTNSTSEQDVMHSYMLHANAFITKPQDFEGFLATIRHIDDFYLTRARLPRHPRAEHQ